MGGCDECLELGCLVGGGGRVGGGGLSSSPRSTRLHVNNTMLPPIRTDRQFGSHEWLNRHAVSCEQRAPTGDLAVNTRRWGVHKYGC